MLSVTEQLLQKQRDGKLVTLRSLAIALGVDYKRVLFMIQQARKSGEVTVYSWPEELSKNSILFAVPSPGCVVEIGSSIDELLLPVLTSQNLKGNFAARMYVHQCKISLLGYPRDRNWRDQMEPLYRNLALTMFGKSESWGTVLLDNLPQKDYEIEGAKISSSKRVRTVSIDRLFRCRVCGKPVTDLNTLCRGIARDCLEAIAFANDSSPSQLKILPEEELNRLIKEWTPPRRYLDEEEAEQLYPEGIISIRELADIAKEKGITAYRIVCAMGGDKGIFPVHSETWRAFVLNNTRYFSVKVLEELESLRR